MYAKKLSLVTDTLKTQYEREKGLDDQLIIRNIHSQNNEIKNCVAAQLVVIPSFSP